MSAPLPEQRARRHPAVSEDARERFLAALSHGFSVTHAAAEAGVHRATLYRLRDDDNGFAEAWVDAVEQGCDVLEDEARRRAVDGWDEPVFQKGEQVGTIRRYSDGLLTFLLRGRRPDVFGNAEGAQVPPTIILGSLLQRARDEGAIDGEAVESPAELEEGGS